LAADNPAVHEPDLALSLSNLGVVLAEVRRRDEALTAVQQAVEIYRRLAADNPAYGGALARYLSNMSRRLSDLGRHPEALAAEEQAAELQDRLARRNAAPGTTSP
jgi:tetratricopeptide (TPR) repeat protein